MPFTFDQIFPSVAATLIGVIFGGGATLKQTVVTQNEQTNETSSSTTTTSINVSPPLDYSIYEMANSNGQIIKGDVKVYVQALGLNVTPMAEDVLNLALYRPLNVKSVSPIYSGQAVAAWMCQCRF